MEGTVTVPKDLSNVKSKVIFNLTKRQCVCFSIAGGLGLPVFFIAKNHMSMSSAVLVMIFVMTPMFMFAMYEWYGLPLEKIISNYYRLKFKSNNIRVYQSDNFYRQIENERELEEMRKKSVKKTEK